VDAWLIAEAARCRLRLRREFDAGDHRGVSDGRPAPMAGSGGPDEAGERLVGPTRGQRRCEISVFVFVTERTTKARLPLAIPGRSRAVDALREEAVNRNWPPAQPTPAPAPRYAPPAPRNGLPSFFARRARGARDDRAPLSYRRPICCRSRAPAVKVRRRHESTRKPLRA
jgi:hypothetical protein